MSKREEKYPDTSVFHYFNANPKNKFGGDCVVRAISTALGQPWEQTVRELTEIGIKYGYVLNDPHTYERYLKQKGWIKQKQPRKDDNTKYTGEEFCELLDDPEVEYILPLSIDQICSNIIAKIGSHHIVAIVDGKINDIWDCSEGCIGNYWTLGG